MLKIKDNVDLKELEKFGFNETQQGFAKHYHTEASQQDIELYYSKYKEFYMDSYMIALIDIWVSFSKEINVIVNIFSRECLEVNFESCNKEFYIKDLIDAKLVEKE